MSMVMPAGVSSGTQKMPFAGRSMPMMDSLDSFSSTFGSLSKPFSQPATIVPMGWKPREADCMPTHANNAAGMDGVVDNTVRFKPLPPRYGKTREYQPNEVVSPQRVLAADTLAGTRGRTNFPPFGTSENMPAVLAPYERSAPLEYKMDPTRLDSGFITSPAKHKGMRTIDAHSASGKLHSSFQVGISPSASPTSAMCKFEFDQTASRPQIPVSRRFMD